MNHSLMQDLNHLLEGLRGSTIVRDLRLFDSSLHQIDAEARGLSGSSDEDLREQAAALRSQAHNTAHLDSLVPAWFALVREVADRTLGLRPFDVQLIAGLALYQGQIAEMQTGEGKTLAAVAPVSLRALAGQGIHVLTFNDYLAQRDATWMGPVYQFLGLSVGIIQADMSAHERRAAYACDITYATAKEAGFDFLRDQMVLHASDRVHRGHHIVLVDEADSILVDEARIPLVVAGSVEAEDDEAEGMADLVRELEEGLDFDTDEYARNVHLTDAGLSRVETTLACGSLHDAANLYRLTQLNLALHARVLLQADVDYIVRGERIEIIDELTGRVVDDRHWPDGLQAAIEAKERVKRRADGVVLGTITLQHFLEQYDDVCGMTATACPAAEELDELYRLGVVVIPPHHPCTRRDESDIVFTHQEAKHHALVPQIDLWHRAGRPVLVGTASVAESEELGGLLKEAGITCQILNARNDEIEARIIADAGAPGAVTISTNMAGRGTDIRLGGHDESGRDQVVALGGLCVIGTNRHESRRIDDQLRGRAGRQGDPGSSCFYISLQDPLIQRFGIDKLIPERYRPSQQEQAFDHPVVRREIDRAQRIVEGQSFDIRRNLCLYSQFVEMQRRELYGRRDDVLGGATGIVQNLAPELYRSRCCDAGEEIVAQVEHLITLYHLDRAWRDHLAQVSALRDGIHLVGLGGLNPVDEFQKVARVSFDESLAELDSMIVETFTSVQIGPDGIDLDREGLRGPSSTWTYLVNDDSMSDHLANLLTGNRNIGLNVGAGLMWPLLALWVALRKFTRRRRSPR